MGERMVKSVVLAAFGSYDQIAVEDHPLAPPADNEVEIEVHYCGVNFCDIVTRVGLLDYIKPPVILGVECSGIVKSLGPMSQENEELPKLTPGDHVVCFNFLGGMFRESVVVRRKDCYKIPEGVSLKDAATIFVNYLTAYCCLFELGNLKEGGSVFIKACAGGVGWAATQLSKTVDNVTIFGACSDSKHESVLENGVDHVYSYTSNYIEEIRDISPIGVSLIIENEAFGDFSEIRSLLAPFGMIVAIGANNVVQDSNKLSVMDFIKMWWYQKDVSVHELIANNRSVSGIHLAVVAEKNPLLIRKLFGKVCDLLKADKIKPMVDTQWDRLEGVIDATRRMGERKNIGKVIIKVVQ